MTFNCKSNYIGSSTVPSQPSARNLGVVLDSSLSMSTHIANVCKSCYGYLRAIGRIRKYLSQKDAEKLVHALITSRLDSCNSLLAGLPMKNSLEKLLRVQKVAARIVTRTSRYDHITPVFKQLHWLPIKHRIDFKVCVLSFKCLHGLAPNYLKELVSWYVPNRSLRSGAEFKMTIDCAKKAKVRYAQRAFQHYAPVLWNSLPLNVRSSHSLDIFKSRCKTYLFTQAFN